jgi:hypothetical protein
VKALTWLRDVISASTRNPLSLSGAILATASAAIIVTLLLLELFGGEVNPYAGLLVFLILPGVFVLGLVLIPIGILRRPGRAVAFPILDLNLERHRTRFLGFAILTFVNLVILGTATYRGVEYMDSPRFCGQACHSVMHPEYSAYERSPHARVPCVSCHTGSGAGGFARAKLAGVGQVVALVSGTVDRPIHVPVATLRPARETCERCHWPEKFHGERLVVKTTYAEDEKNTELSTVLMLKVGGGSPGSGQTSGIHWHMNVANEVTYVPADPGRRVIPFVRVRRADGSVTDYLATGATPPAEAAIRASARTMDCVDCHNRPAHVFRLPGEEVDRALRLGRIDRTLPYIKKVAVEILKRSYGSGTEAETAIPAALEAHYRDAHPEVAQAKAGSIRNAGRALAEAYARNVFPRMKIAWGTYPSHLGHADSSGCFRCHNGDHASADGRTVTAECDACHAVLAVEEEHPEILGRLQSD